jgi:hypothetical protein
VDDSARNPPSYADNVGACIGVEQGARFPGKVTAANPWGIRPAGIRDPAGTHLAPEVICAVSAETGGLGEIQQLLALGAQSFLKFLGGVLPRDGRLLGRGPFTEVRRPGAPPRH